MWWQTENLSVTQTRQKLNRFHDDQSRYNLTQGMQIQALQGENQELKRRIGTLIRLLISKEIVSAAEMAAAIAEMAAAIAEHEALRESRS